MPHRVAANLMVTQHQALAQAVVARQYERQPELRQRYGESGAAKCVQDTEYHLAYLAAAVMFSSPALFKDYIGWVKTVLTVRNIHLEDVENNLVCLWAVLQEQLPEESAAVVQPYIEDAFRVQPQRPSDLPTLLGENDALTALARRYLQALLRTERHEASCLIREAFQSGVTITDLYLQVFQRCQREIGRLWLLNQVTVTKEHYCTAAAQLVMAQFYPYLFSLPKNGRRLVATAVAGELHEVGLRIVTDLFEANGWNTVYFGANVPAQSLIQTFGQHRPDVLAVSVTMAYHLPAVEKLIALVRSATDSPAVKIMVGGYPFNLDSELWRRVGADAYASDASEALQTANRLLDTPTQHEERGRKTFPALSAPRSTPQPGEDVARYDELSRLNSDLLTLQRELAKKNADLEREITERKRLEEQVRQAQKMEAIGRLAGGVAHSLNNLMTSVLGYSEVMLGSMKPADPFFASVQEIKRSSSRTVALTQKLLAFSRKQLLTLRRVDLNAVVSGLEPTLRAMLGRIPLELDLDPGLASTQADQDHLEEAILVLVRNALDAMPDGGRLTIQTSKVELGTEYVQDHPEVCPGPYVMLSVSDTGGGMDEETVGHLFEPFYSSKKASSGSGLGLAAVYGFVKQCGGDIAVQSVRHVGTTFCLYLPRDEERCDGRKQRV